MSEATNPTEAEPVPRVVPLNWKDFRERLLTYAGLSRGQRSRYLFRGQQDVDWPLLPTLDRHIPTQDDGHRQQVMEASLREFRTELSRLCQRDLHIPEDDDALELLARHHGLPSPLLDWTQSPWIASYFAFERITAETDSSSDTVAVWMLDRGKAKFGLDQSVDLIDNDLLIRFNPRALIQRGVFLQVNTGQSVDLALAKALTRYEINRGDRALALADMDEMGINATRLMADVGGAAVTAWVRTIMGVGE